MSAQLVQIPVGAFHVEALLHLPAQARGLVLFAHGGGSSRHSPRNNRVAQHLQAQGLGTLLLDLLTLGEKLDYHTRFDYQLLTERLIAATHWVQGHIPPSRTLHLGYFGASTGAAAALQAAARLGVGIRAVVSRGGRPDLAGPRHLHAVHAPCLLLVGSQDPEVLELNQQAYAQLGCTKELCLISGASHLFAEPGTLDAVAEHAAQWFGRYLVD